VVREGRGERGIWKRESTGLAGKEGRPKDNAAKDDGGWSIQPERALAKQPKE
jgi:hypothetical protein